MAMSAPGKSEQDRASALSQSHSAGNRASILAWLPVIGSAAAVAIILYLHIDAAWNSPVLLLFLNTLFLSIVSFLVSILAGQSYLAGQGKAVLLLGCGTLALGLGAVLAGLPPARNDPNYTITMYNTAALLASICNLAGAGWALRVKESPRSPSGVLMAVLYPSIILFLILETAAVREGLLPAFFIEGYGATACNLATLWTAAGLFSISALLLWNCYRRTRSAFMRWYSMGLMLIVIGLLAVSLQRHFGSPLNWAGRGAQYVGGVYMLVAVICTARQNRKWTISIEAALRQSEDRYRSLMEMSPEAVFVDRDGRVVFVNPAAVGLFGAASAELLLGRSPFDLFHPDFHGIIRGRISALLDGKAVPIIEARIRRIDGGVRDVALAAAAVDDGNGRAIQVVLRDVTERKQAETLVRSGEERLRLALDAGHMATWDWHVPSGEVVWNDHHFRMLGYEPGEIAPGYSAWADRIHPDDRAATETALRQSMDKGADYSAEFRVCMPDGEVRWLEARGRFEHDPAGDPTRSYGVMIDITDRKKAEEERHFLLDELQAVLDAAPVAIWIAHDPECRRITGNAFADEMVMNVRRGENISRSAAPGETVIPYRTLRNGKELKPEELPAQFAASTGRRLLDQEMDLVFPDGRIVSMLMGALPLFDGHGRVRGSVTAGVDITQLKQAEQMVRESEQRFRSLFNGMIEGFAIHEIIVNDDGTPEDYRFLDINPAFEQMTGLRREDVVGRTHNEVLPGDDPKWLAMYGEVALTGKPVQFENYSPALRRHYEVVAYRPAPMQFAVIFMDITFRKQSDEALRKALAAAEEGQRTLAALMEYAPEGITIADAPAVNIRMVSRYGQDVLGAHHDQMTAGEVARRWTVYHADGITPLATEELPLVRAIQRGETVQNAELVQVNQQGKRMWLLCNAGPIRDDVGSIVGGIVVWRDITERRRVEEMLREGEERLRLAQESANVGIWDWKVETGALDFTPELNKLYGLPSGAIRTYKDWRDRVHPEDISRIEKSRDEAIARHESFNLEFRGRHSCGEYRWISTQGGAIYDESGKVLRVLGVNLDITDRKRAEETIRNSERLYRGIGESIDYGVWVCAPDGRNIYASESFLKLVGMTQQQCSDFGWGDVLHPDDAERTINAWKECVRTGGTWDIEHRFRGVDGRWHPILARGVPVRNDRGEITCWAGINLDIRRIKQAEEAVARRNALLAGINNVFEAAMQRQSEEEFCEACLDVAESVTGSRISFIGEMGTDGYLHSLAISNPGRAACKSTDQAGLRRPPGNFPIHGIYGRVLKDGKGLIVNDPPSHPDRIGLPEGHPPLTAFLGVPLMRGEKLFGMIAVGNRDGGYRAEDQLALETLAPAFMATLGRKRAEEARRRTVEELQRSNRELEQFAYISSHDLQEPLRQVQAFVQLLRDRYSDKLDGKAAQYMQFVYDGAARMSDLVGGLLAYSRLGGHDAPRQPVPCQLAMDTALANLQASIAESRARITHDELPTVMAGSTLLTQLFQNLIGNAIKFHRDGVPPAVHVGCRREGAVWLFSVSDNGIGISREHHERVFMIFQRLHGRAKYPGTGIGLAICKKIVEQHGGRIWIESDPGTGSTFCFTMPQEL